MKLCNKCKVEKSLTEFCKDATRKGGFSYICKVCASEKYKKYYVKNIDAKKEKGIQYYWRDVEKNKKKHRETYWSNPEFAREKNRSYYWGNPEKFREKRKKQYAANPEAEREKTKFWRKVNMSRVISYNNIRRAEKLKAMPVWLSAIELAQTQEFYDIAKAKSVQTGIKFQVDHIIPLKGDGFNGLHVPWNLQILTAEENNKKRNKLGSNEAMLGWSK